MLTLEVCDILRTDCQFFKRATWPKTVPVRFKKIAFGAQKGSPLKGTYFYVRNSAIEIRRPMFSFFTVHLSGVSKTLRNAVYFNIKETYITIFKIYNRLLKVYSSTVLLWLQYTALAKIISHPFQIVIFSTNQPSSRKALYFRKDKKSLWNTFKNYIIIVLIITKYLRKIIMGSTKTM